MQNEVTLEEIRKVFDKISTLGESGDIFDVVEDHLGVRHFEGAEASCWVYPHLNIAVKVCDFDSEPLTLHRRLVDKKGPWAYTFKLEEHPLSRNDDYSTVLLAQEIVVPASFFRGPAGSTVLWKKTWEQKKRIKDDVRDKLALAEITENDGSEPSPDYKVDVSHLSIKDDYGDNVLRISVSDIHDQNWGYRLSDLINLGFLPEWLEGWKKHHFASREQSPDQNITIFYNKDNAKEHYFGSYDSPIFLFNKRLKEVKDLLGDKLELPNAVWLDLGDINFR